VSTDFQLAPTDADPRPHTTDHPEQVTVPAPAPQPTTPASTVDHTPGGLPVIPLAVIAGNSTIAGLSAIAVSVGPAAAAAAAGGVFVSAVAVRAAGARNTRKTRRDPGRNRQPQKQTTNRTPQQAPTRRTPAPAPKPTGGRRATGSASTGTRTRPTTAGRTTGSAGPKGAGRPSGAKVSLKKKPTSGAVSGGAGTKQTPKTKPGSGSRASQIKQLRRDKAAATPSRKERRTKDLAARRALADGRREAKRDAKDLKRASRKGGASLKKNGKATSPSLTKRGTVTAPIPGKGKGAAAHTLRAATRRPGVRGWLGHQADKARTGLRAAYDKATANRTARIKRARTKAKARAVLARQRGRAHTRYALQAAGRALLAAPVGLLGALTTPLGKRLGWAWLQNPGRRLYRRLTAGARLNRDQRLAYATNDYVNALQPTDPDTPTADPQPIADTVARAPRTGASPHLGDTDMSEEIKLHFLETSEDTLSAARAYEPGGMLHVRQVIRAMPVALEHWAQTFAVLAEKSDAEFPLGDEIGEGLDDIHRAMRQLIDRAEDLTQTFDKLHEADIDRLLNPRKSRDAERGWDVAANEDYDE
jgi:hypothetical protein